ncbi:MAG: FAD-dependent monooxygenase [Acidobacteria bacterium]|nr:FAD-dependent monooxygenase [Acidobacteriota bacterium]
MNKREGKVLIAGGGPAGASLAIRLASAGREVVLIERDRFPRHKLCGEFISPECFGHFAELGVLEPMLSAGGERITETLFFPLSGRTVRIPGRAFGEPALGLSRSAMDAILLDRARAVGVEVIEGAAIASAPAELGELRAIDVRTADGTREIAADIFIDATGRGKALVKAFQRTKGNASERPARRSNGFVAFKAHLRGAELAAGRCEIHFFPGGYGGINRVEGGAVNHCFLVRSEAVKSVVGRVEDVLEKLVYKNASARNALIDSTAEMDWMAVSFEGFGRSELSYGERLFTVGDAASFIDPFTGSGMLMAIESSAVLAESLAAAADAQRVYAELYAKRFRRRLFVCSLLRNAAFRTRAATFVSAALGGLPFAAEALARLTRPQTSAAR